MSNKSYLKDLQLHKKEDGKCVEYYLSAVYHDENDAGIYEITIPHIHLPLNEGLMIIQYNKYLQYEPDKVDLGFGELPMLPDENGHMYYQKLIKEKVHDLTLSEIEKKLGYKVRIVGEKKE